VRLRAVLIAECGHFTVIPKYVAPDLGDLFKSREEYPMSVLNGAGTILHGGCPLAQVLP